MLRTMGGGRRGRPQHAPGQGLVEFALIAPLLLLLVLGFMAAWQIASINQEVSMAARVAAHQAALTGGDVDAVTLAAHEALRGGVLPDPEHAVVTVTCSDPCTRYSQITVEIAYTGDAWAPVGPFDDFTVVARETRASEQDRETTTSSGPSPSGLSSLSNPNGLPGTTSLTGGGQ
jgi:hypothetical protein